MAEKRYFSIRQLYFYMVCFSTLIIMMIGGIRLVSSVTELLVHPQPPYPSLIISKSQFADLQKQNPHITWEEYKQEMEAERRRQEEYDRVRRIQTLASSIAMVAIPLPIYLIHWRYIREEKREVNDE